MKTDLLHKRLKRRWTAISNAVGERQSHQMFLRTKYSIVKVVSLPLMLSMKVLKDYQQVEKEIWGKVELLPEEQQLAPRPDSPQAVKVM